MQQEKSLWICVSNLWSRVYGLRFLTTWFLGYFTAYVNHKCYLVSDEITHGRLIWKDRLVFSFPAFLFSFRENTDRGIGRLLREWKTFTLNASRTVYFSSCFASLFWPILWQKINVIQTLCIMKQRSRSKGTWLLKTKSKAKIIGDNESLGRIGKDYICVHFLQQLRKIEAQ